MARRFYDTRLIEQRWYMELKPKYKALYIHLLCVCDITGIFEVNPILLSAYIGEPITEDEMYTVFGSRVQRISDTKGMLVDFVGFQQGGELRHGCRPHDAIVKKLAEAGISIEKLQSMSTHPVRYSVSKTDTNAEPIMEFGMATGELHKTVATAPKIRVPKLADTLFDCFWIEYPRKDSKKVARQKWNLIFRGLSDERAQALADTIMCAVRKQALSDQWIKDNGAFIPMPSTWLNQRRWEDEGAKVKGGRHGSSTAKRADSYFDDGEIANAI